MRRDISESAPRYEKEIHFTSIECLNSVESIFLPCNFLFFFEIYFFGTIKYAQIFNHKLRLY